MRNRSAAIPRFMLENTPSQITDEIIRFAHGISPGEKPVYVPVQPAPFAIPGWCFPSVAMQIETSGGTAVHGWIIWQSRILLNAEFHCNWLSPDGELIDITPKVDGESKILFLPDPTLSWNGQKVPSRRQALWDHHAVHQLIRALHDAERGGPGSSDASARGRAAIRSIQNHLEYPTRLKTEQKQREKRKAERKAKKRQRRRGR